MSSITVILLMLFVAAFVLVIEGEVERVRTMDRFFTEKKNKKEGDEDND
jgi:hypothetical protein